MRPIELLPAEYLLTIRDGPDRLAWESTLADIYDLPELSTRRRSGRWIVAGLLLFVAVCNVALLILPWLL